MKTENNTIRTTIRSFLSKRSSVFFILCLSLLLFLPSLWIGFIADDIIHRFDLLNELSIEKISNNGIINSFTEMYSFTRNDSFIVKMGIDTGAIPWWTNENFILSFFRPLSELTYRLDYALWPDSPELMHLHSLLWYAVIILLAAVLYRKISLTPWIAGLAVFLFAVNHTHAIMAGWLANRYSLICTFFGILALLAHHRWRSEGWKAGSVLGPLCLVLGLLAGEYALAACGYLFSYMLFLEKGSIRTRIISVLSYGIIVVVWAITYKGLGFGSSGSGAYITPFNDPAGYLAAVLERLPILLGGQWGFFIPILYMLLNKPVSIYIVSVILLILITVVIYPYLRKDPVVRFWTCGMILALLPLCSVIPSDRLLLFSNIGAMAIMAHIISTLFEKKDWLPDNFIWKTASRFLMLLIIIFHIIISPLYVPGSIMGFYNFHDYHTASPAKTFPETADLSSREVVLLNPPIAFYGISLFRYREFEKLAVPVSFRVLASGGYAPMELTRTDNYTLRLRIEKGFFKSPFDDLYMDPHKPLQAGETVFMKGPVITIESIAGSSSPGRISYRYHHHISRILLQLMKNKLSYSGINPESIKLKAEGVIEFEADKIYMKNISNMFRFRNKPVLPGQSIELASVSAKVISVTEDQYPREVEFRFTVPLDSKLLRFLYWKDGGYLDFKLPPIGEVVNFEKSRLIPE